MKLHPYQHQMVEYIQRRKRCNLFVPMGLGKTVSAATAMQEFPVLVVAPLRVAQYTWPEEIRKWAHLRHLTVSVITGTPKQRREAADRKAHIYTINYESLPWLIEHLDGKVPYKMIVADECFVAGTLITTSKGQIPIENIRIGDKVLTLNGYRRVTNVFPKKTSSLVRFYMSNGEKILCTPTHLFWTEVGWVEAQYLYGKTLVRTPQMSILPNRVWSDGILGVKRIAREVLRKIMLHKRVDKQNPERVFSGNSRKESPSTYGNVRPMEQGCSDFGIDTAETVLNSGRTGCIQGCARGERYRNVPHGTETSYGTGTRMDMESSYQDKTFGGRWLGKSSFSLQTGFLLAREDDMSRSGWFFPPNPTWKNARYKEDKRFDSVRVVGVETVECPSGTDVWDIEVDEQHHFFANGVLTHNCSKLKGFRTRQGTKRAKALAKLAIKVPRYVGLTGTPAANGILDIWALCWFVDAGKRLGKTFSAFRDRWFRAVQVGNIPQAVKYEPYPNSQSEIEALIKDICMSLDVKDHFDLDTPITNILKVNLPQDVMAQYREMERDMYLSLHEVEAVNAAAKTQKCLQLANGFIYLDDRGNFEPVHDLKLQALESIVEESGGAPILVAYNFKADLARILSRFPQAEHIGKDPETLNRWNRGEIPMMVFHPKSAGHGLSLQHGGNTLVFYGIDWALEERLQAIERIGPVRQKQSGYDRPVFIHYIIADKTIDEVVLSRVDEKKSVLDTLMEAMKCESRM